MTEEKKTALYESIRDKLIDSVVKAVVWAIAAVVLWALYTAYSLDSKMDRENSKIKAEMIDGFNDAVKRDAAIQAQINDLLQRKLPELPPLPPVLGSPAPQTQAEPPNPRQQPLDYMEQHLKKYSK